MCCRIVHSQLLPFVHSMYCSTTFPSWGDEVVLFSEGISVGQPFGVLLFCLAIHTCCEKLRSEFYVFDLDEGIGTLVGKREDVLLISGPSKLNRCSGP